MLIVPLLNRELDTIMHPHLSLSAHSLSLKPLITEMASALILAVDVSSEPEEVWEELLWRGVFATSLLALAPSESV